MRCAYRLYNTYLVVLKKAESGKAESGRAKSDRGIPTGSTACEQKISILKM